MSAKLMPVATLLVILSSPVDSTDIDIHSDFSGSNVEVKAEVDRVRNRGTDSSQTTSSGEADSDPCEYSVENRGGVPTWICTTYQVVMGGGMPGMSAGEIALETPLGAVTDVNPPGYTVSEAELRSLPISPGGLDIQPPGGSVLINKDVIAYSQAQSQIFTTTVLGVATEVRVVPLEWEWNFQDGSGSFTTTTPGGPYPDKSVTGRYSSVAQDVVVNLQVTWVGQYRVAGSSRWWDVSGTASTVASSAPFDVVEAPTRLVEE